MQINAHSQVTFSTPRKKELAKAAGRLDLSRIRARRYACAAGSGFDGRPAAIRRRMAAVSGPLFDFTSSRMFGTSGRDIPAHAALDETGKICFRAEAVIGPILHRASARHWSAVASSRGSRPSWSDAFCVRRWATMI